jgi:glycosyltransferase involved in cell wall biosynthesis
VQVLLLTLGAVAGAGEAGGFIWSLARALRDRGVDIRLLMVGDGDVPPDLHVRHVPAGPFGGILGSGDHALRVLANGALARHSLRRVVAHEVKAGCKVIHAHWVFPCAGGAIPGIPLVLTAHGPDIRLMERSSLMRNAGRRLVRRASVLTTVSLPLASALQAATGVPVPPERVHAMPVESGDLEWSTGGGGALVLGPLTPEARTSLAVEAVACLAELDHPIRLVIAGDGPERGRLQALAARRGVAALVRFHGEASVAQADALLRTADVLLDPAVGVGFARFQTRAIMSGVPVVACWDGGGTLKVGSSELLSRLVLPSGEAIADSVLDLLGVSGGQDLRRAAGAVLRTQLDARSVAGHCVHWYEEAMANPAPLHA